MGTWLVNCPNFGRLIVSVVYWYLAGLVVTDNFWRFGSWDHNFFDVKNKVLVDLV